MKKALSILLLFVFLFNTVGYKALYYWQMSSADKRMEAKIQHSDYSRDQLIQIKIPLNLPYLADWRDFQPMEGQVVYKKQTYRYVKRKIEKDSLVLLCLADTEKDRLEKVRRDYLKTNQADASKKAFAKTVKYDFEDSSGVLLNAPCFLMQARLVEFELFQVDEVFPDASYIPPDNTEV